MKLTLQSLWMNISRSGSPFQVVFVSLVTTRGLFSFCWSAQDQRLLRSRASQLWPGGNRGNPGSKSEDLRRFPLK